MTATLGYARDALAVIGALCITGSVLTVAFLHRRGRIEDRRDAEMTAFLDGLNEKERD
jgi:hypothetical protein